MRTKHFKNTRGLSVQAPPLNLQAVLPGTLEWENKQINLFGRSYFLSRQAAKTKRPRPCPPFIRRPQKTKTKIRQKPPAHAVKTKNKVTLDWRAIPFQFWAMPLHHKQGPPREARRSSTMLFSWGRKTVDTVSSYHISYIIAEHELL